MDFIDEYSDYYVSEDSREEIEGMASEIMQTGIKNMDSLHIASAIYARADYFLTTDDRILKYATDRIKIQNPMMFVGEMEGKDAQ